MTFERPLASPGNWFGASVQQRLALILALGLAIRVLALLATAPTGLVNDEISYFKLARSLAAGGELGNAGGRAPGVVFFYSGLFSLFGTSQEVARAGNVFLSTASVWLVFILGRRFGDERVGLGAAMLTALYPAFIGFSHCLWSETLYIFLELAALALLASHRERFSIWRLAVAGVLLGMGALTREVGMVAAVLCAGFLLYDLRPAWWAGLSRSALVLATCLAIVLPWSSHLHDTTGQFTLISNNTWFNVFVSNVQYVLVNGERVHPWIYYESLGESRSEREDAARPIALKAIRDLMPLWPIQKLGQLRHLLAPHSFTVKHLRTGPDSEQPGYVAIGNWGYRFSLDALENPLFRETAAQLTILSYLVVVLAGVAGLVLARNSRMVVLFSLSLAGHVLPPLVTFAITRFRLPLMPIMAISAAPLLFSFRQAVSGISTRRRVVAAIAVAATSLAIVVGHFTSPP